MARERGQSYPAPLVRRFEQQGVPRLCVYVCVYVKGVMGLFVLVRTRAHGKVYELGCVHMCRCIWACLYERKHTHTRSAYIQLKEISLNFGVCAYVGD